MKLGLVYSGGLAKGAYQVGFTKALLEFVDPRDIDVVSSSSMGMSCAYALAADKLNALEQIWSGIDIRSGFATVTNLMFGKMLDGKIDLLMDENDELAMPVYFNVCYLPLKVQYVKLEGKYRDGWRKLMRAGMGFPVLTGAPVRFNRRLAMDGGAIDNIPLFPLLAKERLDLIIVLHFDAYYNPSKEFSQSVLRVLDFDLSYNNRFVKESYDLRQSSIRKMLDSGYEYGKYVCKQLFKDGKDCAEDVYRNGLEVMKEEKTFREHSPTVDALFSLLNKVGKIFRNYAVCVKNFDEIVRPKETRQ